MARAALSLFCEDLGHEAFVKALLRVLASAEGDRKSVV